MASEAAAPDAGMGARKAPALPDLRVDDEAAVPIEVVE